MCVLKRSVFVGLVLLGLVPWTDAGCWVEKFKKDVTHCQDGLDKTWHPVGSSWTNSKCNQCVCKANLMDCCYGIPSPRNYAEDCTVEYDYEACTYKVFKKSDPTILCPHSAVL